LRRYPTRPGLRSRKKRRAPSNAISPAGASSTWGPRRHIHLRHRHGPFAGVAAPGEGILARQREVNALVELRVPFELDRQQIDDVERGANDSDWQPAKDAARLLAFAEDRAIFEGYGAAGITGSAREPAIR
jgi:Uncharacterized protein, linocin/CFP29 homolog